jgi:hypothetical protein
MSVRVAAIINVIPDSPRCLSRCHPIPNLVLLQLRQCVTDSHASSGTVVVHEIIIQTLPQDGDRTETDGEGRTGRGVVCIPRVARALAGIESRMTWLSSPPHNHAVWFSLSSTDYTLAIILTITASSSLNIIYPHSCVAALFRRLRSRGCVVSLSRPFVVSSFPPFRWLLPSFSSPPRSTFLRL